MPGRRRSRGHDGWMTRALACVAALALLSGWTSAAHAGCTTDRDCKGARICVDGVCEYPPAQGPGASRARPTQEAEPSPRWAVPAGIIGLGAAAAVLGVGIASEMTKHPLQPEPSLPLGALAAATRAAAGPVVFVGGRSARRSHPSVRGVPALRPIAWVTWGLGLAGAGGLALASVFSESPPLDGMIVTTAATGAASLLFFATDALIAAEQAVAVRKASAVAEEGEPSAVLVPWFTPTSRGGAVGVAASF